MLTLRQLVENNGRDDGDRSQFGEGSIISECLRRIDLDRGLVVEFGAGDGLELSNTAHLWQAGWPAVLIEADDQRAAQLRANVEACWETSDELEVVAERATVVNIDDHVDRDPAVLSVDVDGDDYSIVQRMTLEPRVLCVEHHPMIPLHVQLVGGPDVGCSAGALIDLLESKAYTVVAMTHCNTIAVRTVDAFAFGAFADVELDPRIMFDPSGITFAVSDVRTGDYRMHGPWPFGRGDELAAGG